MEGKSIKVSANSFNSQGSSDDEELKEQPALFKDRVLEGSHLNGIASGPDQALRLVAEEVPQW